MDTISSETVHSISGILIWLPMLIILPLIALGIYILFERNGRMFRMGMKIPGPPPVPVFGNALMAVGKSNTDLVKMALAYNEAYGDVVRIFLGPKLIVGLVDPRDIEIILNSNLHLEKSSEYRYFKPWLGDGLLISNGHKWRSHRKLIAPAFHQNVLKSFVGIFNSNSVAVVDKFRKVMGTEFDVHDFMSETTVDILLETAMGTQRTNQDKEGYDYAMAVMKMCDILHARQFRFYYRIDAIFNLSSLKRMHDKFLNTIHTLTRKVVQRKKEKYQKAVEEGNIPKPTFEEVVKNEYKVVETMKDKIPPPRGLRDDLDEQDESDVGEKRRLAFLDLMIESAYTGANISDEELKEEVDTIMFEGHDTTAAGSSFALCLLGIHHHIQDKVYNELFNIFGDSDRPATFTDTLEMKYLERVILESLRLYPPVPVIARKIHEDIKLVSKDYTIPSGTTIVIGIFKVHRRPDIYPKPEIFDPDNFLPERAANRHYYSFIPFSAGPRSCVGRKYAMIKLKILLSTILRNYRVVSPVSEKEFVLQGDIILKRADGFRLQLEPRIRKAI